MEMVPLKPERKAQLDEYARRHRQDLAAALDDVLAAYFDEEQRDYTETIRAVPEAYEEVKAGRTRPAAEVLEKLRLRHGLPR
jgi:predicted transcriptional regulator